MLSGSHRKQGKVPRITSKAPHWDCGTDITCISEFVSTYKGSMSGSLLFLNPYSYYLLLLHTYLLQGGTPVWSVNWTSNLGEILVDVIYSRRTTTNKRETTLLQHVPANSIVCFSIWFRFLSFSYVY